MFAGGAEGARHLMHVRPHRPQREERASHLTKRSKPLFLLRGAPFASSCMACPEQLCVRHSFDCFGHDAFGDGKRNGGEAGDSDRSGLRDFHV